MQIEVLVERSQSNGFRATASIHPEMKAEAATEDAAIRLLRDQLSELLKDARFVTITVPVRDDKPVHNDKPWMAAAGCLTNVVDGEAYRNAIHEYRRQVQADDGR